VFMHEALRWLVLSVAAVAGVLGVAVGCCCGSAGCGLGGVGRLMGDGGGVNDSTYACVCSGCVVSVYGWGW
jgi:hypothetical protein